MNKMSEKFVNTSEREVEEGTFSKFVPRQKSHRKILSGIRLLSESCKTVRLRSDASTYEYEGKDEDEDAFKQQGDFPYDLLMHQVLARFPIKSLLKSKLVSKEWYSSISSNEFAHVHIKTCVSSFRPSSPIEYLLIQAKNTCYLFHLQQEDIVLDYGLVKLEPNFDSNTQTELCLVGSCNGLLCLSNSLAGYFYIWNPIVYHWQKYSHPCLFSYNYRTSCGFAYVSSTNDYKVVKMVENYNAQEIIVLVFSYQSKEWKQINEHGLNRHVSLTETSPGVLVNDTLFWIMESKDVAKNHVVVGFNLTLEKFDEIPGLIPRNSVTTFQNHVLCVMGGCLSLCSSNMCNEACLSIMKQPGKVESISLSASPDSCLAGFTKAGKAIMLSKSLELNLVDLNSSLAQYFPLVTFEGARRPYMVAVKFKKLDFMDILPLQVMPVTLIPIKSTKLCLFLSLNIRTDSTTLTKECICPSTLLTVRNQSINQSLHPIRGVGPPNC